MTMNVSYTCDGCGAGMSGKGINVFITNMPPQLVPMNSNGVVDWHVCGADCLGKLARKMSNAVDSMAADIGV